MQENLIMLYANNKGADQTVHMHSLISAFVALPQESLTAKLARWKNFKILASLCS